MHKYVLPLLPASAAAAGQPSREPLRPTPRVARQKFVLETSTSTTHAQQQQKLRTVSTRSLIDSTNTNSALNREALLKRNARPAGAATVGALGEKTVSDAACSSVSLEEQVQQLVASGAAQPQQRLRWSSSNNRPLFVARLPEDFSALQQPLSIQRDCLSRASEEALPARLRAEAEAAAPWRLKDSSDLSSSSAPGCIHGVDGVNKVHAESSSSYATGGCNEGDGGMPAAGNADASAVVRRVQKLFVSKPTDVNSDCFFLLVQGQEYTDVLPISGWVNFERCAVASGRGMQQQPLTADEAERQSRAKAAREAALASRVAQLRRRRDSDDETTSSLTPHSRVFSGGKTRATRPLYIHSGGSSSKTRRENELENDDELGIKKQRQKRMKQLLRQKTGQQNKTNDYIDSALSLAGLRQAEVDWDFEEGERSDDEDDIATEQQQQQADGTAAEFFEDAGGAGSGDLPNSDDDLEGVADTADLTNYGQKMKTLLDKAKDDEADDELHQYECDDEEEESGAGPTALGGDNSNNAAAVGASPPGISSTSGLLLTANNAATATRVESFVPASGLAAGSTAAAAVQQQQLGPSAGAATVPTMSSSKSGGKGSSGSSLRELECRVIRIMQQHMGRMTVKNFMSAFKVREKNEEFKRIQQVVHKICKMETTEDKQKFIILKPEFRM